MFLPPEEPLLWPAEVRFPESCYLHTLTFRNPEPDYPEARRRWDCLSRLEFAPRGWFGVCVPQWGETTGRLHFHLVTSVRWPSKELWALCDKYAFGRYDVRERPLSAAMYAARYVGRSNYRPEGLEGARLWSVFGKKFFPNGVSRSCDVRCVQKSLQVVADSPQPFSDWLVTRYGSADNEQITVQLRPDAVTGQHIRMNEIQQKHFDALRPEIAAGRLCGIGEYRHCVVNSKEAQDYKNPRLLVRRVTVEHRIEFGGVQQVVEERLPDNFAADTFVAPAKSGEMVGFALTKVREFNKVTTWQGVILKLNTPTPAGKGGAS